ncbi:hydroxyacid dehydrogenase [Thermosphaera chiliense]|uniref:Hydroxyacid dehydrogenase n=1 Tax=Thermosphaera chiliense TaxID=3402707 RepID=A0A7M1UTQ7_9CREN|nr:hydroxyacid dehydrogenase [Thermosphaera aggregans]
MKILVASRIHEKAIQLLRENGFEVSVVEEPPEEELARLIKGFDGLIVRSKPLVTRKVIESADRLKVIARAGVGLDNIDVEAAKEKGITLINAPESSTQSVAELAVGLMLAVARKIAFSDRKMREGYWAKKEAMGVELSGKTLGVIGAGRIGSAVARIAKYGFNMHILYYDVSCREDLSKELGAECVSIEELLKRSDIVTIHVPLLPETRHMINEQRLRLMKKTAILINTSRGAVVDTAALVKALSEGWIAGAGLDVFEEEPLPRDHPLTKLENVVLTPHIGASTKEAQEKAGIEVARKIVEFFKK